MRISAIMRISIGMTSLTLSALLSAHALGLIPDAQRAQLEARRSLCESVAVQCCLAAQRGDTKMIEAVVQSLVERNDQVLSAAVATIDGKLLSEMGEHRSHWQVDDAEHSAHQFVQVPIFQGRQPWGNVQIRFSPLARSDGLAALMSPTVRLVAFVACAGFLLSMMYLRRVLQHLDPSTVIPDRVRATLDSLAEGVLVLDKDQRVVLANRAFAQTAGEPAEALQGKRAPRVSWKDDAEHDSELPWEKAMRGDAQRGVLLKMTNSEKQSRTFVVNSTPIQGSDGNCRGALATFDDVTDIEWKNIQLEEMLDSLQQSRDEIRRQNEELTLLATRDPLTGCFNRRAFFSQFESHWQTGRVNRQPLGCVMVDIDHFKSINDNHGHATGDQVLQLVAQMIRTVTGDRGLVCRYGGEEFCVLVPNADVAAAVALAETIRQTIEATPCAELNITASLGASDSTLGADEPAEMLDQADKALYFSKRNGRNRVTDFRHVPTDMQVRESNRQRGSRPQHVDDVAIPFHAVTALTSALAYRDSLTGEHSRRVADLCVIAARGLMSERQIYVLEVAALLHDIGKLGVPDAILLKPGPLNDDEWKVMATHDRIGVEIIRAAFSSDDLTRIVRTHHAWFGGNPRDPGLPTGDDIPLGARVLAIADAFDAMVSDRVYRQGCPRETAFTELRRCAGRQFDPRLVEHFIQQVTESDQSRVERHLAVSKQAALRVGVQMEQLATALDEQDFPNLAAMAGRLSATASREGIESIADLAADLQAAASSEPNLINVVALTTELLELCRSTQKSYLEGGLEEEDEELLTASG